MVALNSQIFGHESCKGNWIIEQSIAKLADHVSSLLHCSWRLNHLVFFSPFFCHWFLSDLQMRWKYKRFLSFTCIELTYFFLLLLYNDIPSGRKSMYISNFAFFQVDRSHQNATYAVSVETFKTRQTFTAFCGVPPSQGTADGIICAAERARWSGQS